MDLSQYSDDELMQIAGIKPKNDLSGYSDAELMKIAGIEPKGALPQMTPEKQAMAKEKAKQTGIKMGNLDTGGEVKGAWANTPGARRIGAIMQGLGNAGLNPFGYAVRAAGVDTKAIKDPSMLERALEQGAGQAYDFAALAGIGKGLANIGLLGKGKKLPSKIARALLNGDIKTAGLAGGLGGALKGAMDSDDPIINFGLDLMGGAMVGGIGGLAKGLINNKPKVEREQAFINAFMRRKPTTYMKQGVQAGDDRLRAEADDLYNKMMAREKAGFNERAANPRLDDLIKMPRMKRAEKEFNAYIEGNKDTVIPTEKLAEFYARHPVAGEMLDYAKAVDPVSFENYAPQSVAETIYMKQMLKKASQGAGQDLSGVAKAKGAKTAEEELKTLLDETAPGYRDVNRRYAAASTAQDLMEKRITKNAGRVAEVEPTNFFSGITTPILFGAGSYGYAADPKILAGAIGGLAGKAGLRAARRAKGRAAAKGVTSLPEMLENALKQSGKSLPRYTGYSYIEENQ